MLQNVFLAKLMTQLVLPTDIAFELSINDPLLSGVNSNFF